ncbi:unnamed protein product [Urochloa decumbens]|uniref:C2H2-type domain-containing protein n=1 Tax=Urochloa decumbens TaxID=240449 RepID=A0ABC9A8Y5_9POAL
MTLTRHEAEESKEMEGLRVDTAAMLSLQPSSPEPAGGGSGSSRRAPMAAEGVFECKTCSKRFASFQALGGHRTSHTRLQARMLSDPAGAAAAAERDRAARVHECAVCGLEFSMGQALGGHMRRHRGEAPPGASHSHSHDGGAAQQTDHHHQAMPDLNFPPSEGAGGDGQDEQQSADRSSKPRLLNLLV